APPAVHAPTNSELVAAARVIAAQGSAMPSLVYLRDKALLFNDDKTAFVMYAVQGRTWAALGDPVGPPEATPALRRRAHVLRGGALPSLRLRRARARVPEARRGGDGGSDAVHRGRQRREEVP